MSLHVLTYLYARSSSPSVVCHFVRSLGAHASGVDVPDPSPLGSGMADAPDPLPLGSGEAAVFFTRSSRWVVGAPSPGGTFAAI
jgi:hypothetical protein